MILDYVLGRHLSEDKGPDEWDLAAADVDLQEYFGLKPGTIAYAGKNREQIREAILDDAARGSTTARRRSSAPR